MKTFILLLSCFFLLPIIGFTQDLEFTFQKKQSTFGLKIQPVDDHRFVACFRGLNHSSAILMMFDSLGNTLWEQSTDIEMIDHIADITMHPDTSFLIIGWEDAGDYVSGADVCRIDKTGNYLASSSIEMYGHPPLYNCAYWDGDLSLINDINKTNFTPGGVVESDLAIPETVNDFERITDLSTVLVAKNEGIFSYPFGNGDFSEPTDCTEPVYQIKYGLDSTVVILTESSIKTLNADLLVLYSIPLPDSLNNFKLAVDEEQIYLTGKSDNYQPYLFIFNDTLGLKNFSPILSNHQIINDIQIFNHQLLVIGDDHLMLPMEDFQAIHSYGHQNGMNAFFKSFDTFGNTQNRDIDVGITSVEAVGNPIYMDIDSCYNWSNDHWDIADITLPETRVEVTNFGTETIESLKINFRHRRCPNPFIQNSHNYFEWTFENLNLVAGESTMLDLGEIFMNRYPFDQDPNLCFWTSVPNQKLDVNHANDLHCYDYLLSDTKETTIVENLIQVYPNPVDHTLFVNLKQPINQKENLNLYNSLGQKIATFPIAKGVENLGIEVQSLNTGAYFWEINLPNQYFAGRFLKL